ncbi:MAG: hypothetical protein J6D03_05810 [Clostridia bacterium]|nr:hypothetical protein [Clostridia bacterium]
MIFIGIVTDTKSESYINKIRNNNDIFNKYHIIFIKEKSIENIKNIKFDTIIINREFNEEDYLNKLIAKTKYLIINEDIDIAISLLKDVNSNIITYGFNSKSTITMSSVTEDSIQICVQRNILSKQNEIEQQEISLAKDGKSEIYDIMLLISMLLLYDKNDINLVKF